MLFFARYILVVSLSVSVLSGCTLLDFNSGAVANPSLAVEKPSESKKSATVKAPRVKEIQQTVESQTIAQYTQLSPQAKQCIQKYYVGYEYALCLYNSGDVNSAIDYLNGFNADNQLAAELLQKISRPLVYIVNKANQQTNEWLNRKTELGAFKLQKPKAIDRQLSTVSLSKEEFETTDSFNQRVTLAKKEMKAREMLVEKRYQEKLATYNQALDTYNANIEQEKQDRTLNSLDVYLDYVNTNIVDVLGEPYFSDPIYDADKQQMFSNLHSKKSSFYQPVAISVALENAKAFKTDFAKVFPVLEFDASRELLTVVGIGSELNGKVYKTDLLNNNKHAASLSKTVSINIISNR